MATEMVINSAGKCCFNCHFMVDTRVAGYWFSVEERTRRDLWNTLTKSDPQNMTENILADYRCDKGIWVQIKTSDFSELIKDRGESCFFYPHRNGLRLTEATELEHREVDQRAANRNRGWIKYAVWIALATLIVSVLMLLRNRAWEFWR